MSVCRTPRITQATHLLASQLDAPVPGFATLIHRGMRLGAVSPQWLPLLDQRIFELDYPDTPGLPVVRLRGDSRRDGVADLPDGSVDEWLQSWAHSLKDRDMLPGWRGERVDVFATESGEPLFSIERSLVRPLGLMLRSVQVNVYCEIGGQLHVWVAQRSAAKPVDGGLWDTLVGGGIGRSETPLETLIREAAEEAGIERRLARRARPVGVIDSVSATTDRGSDVLHRERLNLYDLLVPPEFSPSPDDGEIAQAVRIGASDLVHALASPERWSPEGAWATTHLIQRHRPAPVAAPPTVRRPATPGRDGA